MGYLSILRNWLFTIEFSPEKSLFAVEKIDEKLIGII